MARCAICLDVCVSGDVCACPNRHRFHRACMRPIVAQRGEYLRIVRNPPELDKIMRVARGERQDSDAFVLALCLRRFIHEERMASAKCPVCRVTWAIRLRDRT